MSNVLEKMIAQLSEDDKQVFEALSLRLKQVKGDINLLSEDDIKLIQQMEKKYGDSISSVGQASIDNSKSNTPAVNILDTPFAAQVRQIIARDLGAKFPQEEDAVAFIFENKWLPVDCQDKSIANDLYQNFELDIREANQWREDLGDKSQDKSMALGLAWFMVIFQMHKRLSE